MATAPAPMASSDRLRLARLRLAAQGLLPGIPAGSEPARTPADVVRRMGMMQAQDLVQACWALGVRLPGSTLAQVHAALESGGVVRSWGARGTLMFLDPKMLRPLLGVTAPRMRAQAAATWRRENITEAELESLLPVVVERCATAGASRSALMEAMSAAGSDVSGQRGYHLLVALSLSGELVQGRMEPGSGTRQLFMDSSQWSPGAGPEATAMDPEDAVREIVLRYFRSHGPATVADCAWWLGLGLTPVRAALKTMGDQLATRELGGSVYHLAPEIDALWDDAPGARSVLALPGFDEFLLGYKDRTATLAPEHSDAIAPGGNGVFRRTLVSGGQTVGTWQVETTGKERSAVAVPFAQTSASHMHRMNSSMAGYLDFRAG
ncbi:winged helix DNA-binding domain-containing protein [Paeniglutamicibacter sp. NPDC091659]|uniref:winged helix DNA-binding domain-containing protein n=1 Tax=Paeniglutamicibacter sp. NPDC091659 TaxID=3364389 RepID=UPI0037F3FD18